MRVYEEYDSPQEKRKAQKGASRGQSTGLARGYLLVFEEDGWAGQAGVYNALGSLLKLSPGDNPVMIGHVTPHVHFLSERCRRVGFDAMPKSWQKAFVKELYNRIEMCSIGREEQHNQKYRRLIRRKTNELCLNLTFDSADSGAKV
jgi:hypothetical protein